MGLGLNKLLDVSKFIHPKVCMLLCFGMNKLLGQILAVGRAIRTKSLSLFVLFVAEKCFTPKEEGEPAGVQQNGRIYQPTVRVSAA